MYFSTGNLGAFIDRYSVSVAVFSQAMELSIPTEPPDAFNVYWQQMKGIAAAVFRRMRIPVDDPDAWQTARIALWYALQRYNPQMGALTTYYYRVLQSHLSEYMASCRYGIQYPVSLMRSSKGVRQRRLRPIEIVSLDCPLDETDPDDTLADTIPAPTSLEEIERRIAVEQMIDRLRPQLSPRQYTVLSMALGLHGFPVMDEKDISQKLGVSVHTTRSIYRSAIAKIRHLISQNTRISQEWMAIIQ